MMVESNIRKRSRMELLYRCISKLVKYLHDKGHDVLVRTLEHYYDPNVFNRTIYHSRSPADPDATFHEKAEEQHRGCVGIIEESVGKMDLS